jgi:DNA-binding response OmpR family regulator/Flp pilus assembly protein TadD
MSAASKAILIIDPSDQSRPFLELGLKKAGFEVEAVATVADADISLGRRSFDAVIVDAALPDGGAEALLLRFRPRQGEQVVRLLATVDASDADALSRLGVAGAEDVLVRPIKSKDAAARVAAVLERPAPVPVSTTVGEDNGRLDDEELLDIVQRIVGEQRTGAARLRCGQLSGTVYFQSGQVIDAVADNAQGLAAFNRMFTWDRGTWSAVYTSTSERARRIDMDTTALLDQAIVHASEWASVSARVGSLETVYAFEFRSMATSVGSMPPEADIVIRLFDGVRTVREAVATASMDDLRALRIVPLLLDQNLLNRVGEGSRVAEEDDFDRIRHNATQTAMPAIDARLAVEDQKRREADEARRRAEDAERARRAEFERAAAEEMAKIAEEQARAATEEAARRQAEEAARAAAEEAARRHAEDAARVAREAYEAMLNRAREAEESARAADEAARRVREEQERRRAAEEAERQRIEEARRRAEEEVERQRAEEELGALVAEQRRLEELRQAELTAANERAMKLRIEAEQQAETMRRQAEHRAMEMAEAERQIEARKARLTNRIAAITTGALPAIPLRSLDEARESERRAIAGDLPDAAGGPLPSGLPPALEAEIRAEQEAMRRELTGAAVVGGAGTMLVSPVPDLGTVPASVVTRSPVASAEHSLAPAVTSGVHEAESVFFTGAHAGVDDGEFFAEADRSNSNAVIVAVVAVIVLVGGFLFLMVNRSEPARNLPPTPVATADATVDAAPEEASSVAEAPEVDAGPTPEEILQAQSIEAAGESTRQANSVYYKAEEMAEAFASGPVTTTEREEVAREARELVGRRPRASTETTARTRRPRATETEEPAADATPREAQAALDSCANASSEGNYTRTIELCQEAVRADADNASALLYLGKAYHEIGENDRAVQFLERALRLDRRNGTAMVTLGAARQALGDSAGAREMYERYIAANPDTRQADELRRVLESL